MATEPKTHWTDEEGCDGDISLCTDRDGKNFVWLLLHSRSANGRASTAVHALSPELAEDIAAGLVQYAAKARAGNAPDIEYLGETANKRAPQHIWRRGDGFVVTSYSTVLGEEILAFPSDGKRVTSFADIAGERSISDTIENHRRIAESAFNGGCNSEDGE